MNELASREVTDAVPTLIAAAQDERSAVRDAAIKALGRLRDPTGRASLNQLLPLSAILTLARLGDARAIPPLSTIVTNKQWQSSSRIEAATALRALSTPACVDALLNVMPDTQLHGRSGDWARSILLSIGISAIDQLITALKMGGLTAQLVAGVLIDIGDNRGLQAVSDALTTHTDSSLRASIARTLDFSKPTRAAATEIIMPALISALKDEHVGVRNSAASVIAKLAPNPASLLMAGVMQGSLHLTDALVKYFVKVRYLPAIEPLLLELTKASEASQCKDIIEALREILVHGDQQVDPTLLRRISQMADLELSEADYELSVYRKIRVDCSELRRLAQQQLSLSQAKGK